MSMLDICSILGCLPKLVVPLLRAPWVHANWDCKPPWLVWVDLASSTCYPLVVRLALIYLVGPRVGDPNPTWDSDWWSLMYNNIIFQILQKFDINDTWLVRYDILGNRICVIQNWFKVLNPNYLLLEHS